MSRLFGLPIPNPLDLLPSRQKKQNIIEKITHGLPLPRSTPPSPEPSPVPVVVESKVKAGAAGAGAGVVLADLLAPLVDKLPLPYLVKKVVLLLLPVVTSYVAGWLAPHTARASLR